MKKSYKFKALLCIITGIILLILPACTAEKEKKQEQPKDVLTQKVTPAGKIPITVLVKYAFSINNFEKVVEEKFPQIDLVQVGNFTRDRGIVEYARRLEHDDLTDIVMTWPLDVGEQYWEERLLDLSGMSFTNQYHISMLKNITRGGKLYYLPGPAQVRGIVYNKTLFAERGWDVPNNFSEFVALCKKIEASGLRSLQLGFANEEVFDTAFIGYSYGDILNKPQNMQWFEDYNAGKGSFGDYFGAGIDTFQTMMDAGIWQASDLNISYADRERMLFTRKCAMIEDSVLMARMGYTLTGTTDEFALMPFFSPHDNSDWARLYMVCYIGLNKKLALPENKEKYDIVLKLMDFISSPEGQMALSADTGAMYSSVKNVPAPNMREIERLVPALQQGRYAIFPEMKNAQDAFRKALAGMLKGTYTRDDVIRIIDEQNIAPRSRRADEVPIGKASDNFTMIETGNFITDMMRARAETDVALFMDNGKDGRFNGKGISGKIYKGEQTVSDVMRILPDLKHGEAGVLQKATMTGKDLIYTLEYAIPVDNNSIGWFYYFSGLKVEYDPIAEPGKRIKKITDQQGNNIDEAKTYTVAAMDQTLPPQCIRSIEDTGISIADLVIEALKTQGEIKPGTDNRFIIAQ